MARITEVHIYDFDATLFRSPQKPDWWEGPWWSNPDSLSPPCVPASPPGSWWVSNVVSQAKASISAGHVYSCICTGRQQKVEPRVKEILRSGGLSFDHLFLKPGGDTASFKKKVLSGLVRKFPGAVIHFWEDRHDHLRSFMKHIESEGGVGVPHPVPEQYGVVLCTPEDAGMAKSASSTRVAHAHLSKMAGGLALTLRPDYGQSDEPQRGDDSDFTKEGAKAFRLTQKEISRADEVENSQGQTRRYTIVTRPQADGGVLVAAIDVGTGQPWGPTAPQVVMAPNRVDREITNILRWIDKMGWVSDMASSGRMRHKLAFNKYNPDELLSQLVEVLDKYELEEAVDAVKKLTPKVQKAWRSRDR